jgi:Ca-activated chloride channel family protein
MSTPADILSLAAWAAMGAAALTAFAEWLHARRCRRLARLAFGPDSQPRRWTILAAPLRVAAVAGITWSLVALLGFEGGSRLRERNAAATRHLFVMLDVSPSMQLQDAGQGGGETRAARAAQVLKSVMERAPGEQVKMTMACFYSDAMLLVKECGDREIVWNFADKLPLYIAYRPGKTDLVKSLNTGAEFVKDFPRKTTTLLVLTDGDTLPDSGLKAMPSSVGEIIIAGVGDATRGTFIDGHLSRQDHASLSQLARRLGGHYHNANVKQVPSEWLRRLSAPDERADRFQLSTRTLAIIVLAVSAAVLCLLPLALEHLGSSWKPATKPSQATPVPAQGKLQEAAA